MTTSSTAEPYPDSCDAHSVPFHVDRAHGLIAQAYSFERWEDATPVKKWERRHWQAHKRCIQVEAKRAEIARFRDHKARRFEQHREEKIAERHAARYTPFPGPNGTRWAIPWAIVSCESGGENLSPNGATASGYY